MAANHIFWPPLSYNGAVRNKGPPASPQKQLHCWPFQGRDAMRLNNRACLLPLTTTTTSPHNLLITSVNRDAVRKCIMSCPLSAAHNQTLTGKGGEGKLKGGGLEWAQISGQPSSDQMLSSCSHRGKERVRGNNSMASRPASGYLSAAAPGKEEKGKGAGGVGCFTVHWPAVQQAVAVQLRPRDLPMELIEAGGKVPQAPVVEPGLRDGGVEAVVGEVHVRYRRVGREIRDAACQHVRGLQGCLDYKDAEDCWGLSYP